MAQVLLKGDWLNSSEINGPQHIPYFHHLFCFGNLGGKYFADFLKQPLEFSLEWFFKKNYFFFDICF